MDSLFDLHKRYFVVTGASGLLGRQHCSAIIEYSGIPIAIDINNDALISLQNYLKSIYNVDIPIFNCSITDIDQLSIVKKQLEKEDIKISGIINNAAINPTVNSSGLSNLGRMEDYDLKQWDLELDVGLKGSYLVVRVFSDHLTSHLHNGVILNISSDLGLIAPDQRLYMDKSLDPNSKLQPVKPITYSVIKTGLIGMSRYFSTYFKGSVRSNTLCPGGVENNQGEEFKEKISKLIPLGRMAQINEYKGAIIFLLSDASSYMNGACIAIDGGRTVW